MEESTQSLDRPNSPLLHINSSCPSSVALKTFDNKIQVHISYWELIKQLLYYNEINYRIEM